MPPQLYIAKSGKDLAPTLPLDAVTRTFAILGQRGTGKTSTAVVIVEEMARKGGHVAVLDPVGAWYGITRAGEKRGVPGIVLGGEHGDVPLEETAGHLVADLVVGRHWPVVVIDLKLLRKGAQLRFMADYLEGLFHANREPLHVVFEEADRALPQTPRGMDPTLGRVLGAGEDIVKLGRSRGLGATLVTQRPASIAKNVLEVCESLILHRLMGPNDRKAVKGWVEANGDPAALKRVMDSMAQLGLGEAWLYSPGWLRLLERIRVRARHTFDSSATPEVGARVVEPTERAPVNLDELRARMADTVERAKASDPKVLRERIVALQRELAEAREAAPPAPEVEQVRVFVPDQVAITALHARIDALAEVVSQFDEAIDGAGAQLRVAREIRGECEELLTKLRGALVEAEGVPGERAPARVGPEPVPRRVRRGTVWKDGEQIGEVVAPRSNGAGADVTGPEQRVLDALAWWEAIGVVPVERARLAFVAGYHERTKGFLNALGALRSAERIDYPQPGTVALLPAGRGLAAFPVEAPTQAELHERVFDQIGSNRTRMLRPIISAYPATVERAALADVLGYHERTKSFLNGLGKLRTLGLIDYPSPGMVRATELLFPASIRSGAVATRR